MLRFLRLVNKTAGCTWWREVGNLKKKRWKTSKAKGSAASCWHYYFPKFPDKAMEQMYFV